MLPVGITSLDEQRSDGLSEVGEGKEDEERTMCCHSAVTSYLAHSTALYTRLHVAKLQMPFTSEAERLTSSRAEHVVDRVEHMVDSHVPRVRPARRQAEASMARYHADGRPSASPCKPDRRASPRKHLLHDLISLNSVQSRELLECDVLLHLRPRRPPLSSGPRCRHLLDLFLHRRAPELPVSGDSSYPPTPTVLKQSLMSAR